ncbi:Potassium channel subfamily K member 3 (Acid-sensitive potassium channel protein TASK-1) (TWIK-related acid-sensitive K(+) channel 1) (Two pore potassium channel KT3.1) (Two pore K(+) channel KT3.1) [Durusdinium trenchii]|uniref:Potassium channel subfamily K member 3 (Acid-sensitive potassium channel protein TASK-1) (TWIK-related acid-sensitive K(+) channel 1) (Two pore potassium channel KT3.1) (Two pore K(+) channel KT3.1) n=1 Tax=Durusdinium trenchii TaxID=1381693 RepID=A0ABP0P6P1_9DINO
MSAQGVFHSRSFMYSFTLVASIGYGDLYPRTDGGKIFCIFFTLLATPALVVAYLFAARKSIDFMRFLALLMDEQNIRTFHKYDKDESGQLNSNEFKVALHDLGYRVTDDDVRLIMEEVNICDTTLVTIEEFGQAMILLQYPDAKYKKIRQTAMLVALVNLSWVLIGTICFMHLESWTFVESLWFCWETLMTIGLGDLVPHTEAGRPLAKGFWLVHLVARSIS